MANTPRHRYVVQLTLSNNIDNSLTTVKHIIPARSRDAAKERMLRAYANKKGYTKKMIEVDKL